MIYNLKHGVFAHPFEMVACISTFLSVYGGFQLLVYHPEVLDNATSGILSLPKYLIWIWVVVGFIGAVVTGIGLAMTTWSRKGRFIEASGLWLMGSMWLTAGVARAFLNWDAWVEYTRYFALSVGCIFRLIILYDFHESLRKRVEEVEVT